MDENKRFDFLITFVATYVIIDALCDKSYL